MKALSLGVGVYMLDMDVKMSKDLSNLEFIVNYDLVYVLNGAPYNAFTSSFIQLS